MELKVLRYGRGSDSTGGLLFIDGDHFGYVCEDEYRKEKVPGETRIPPGRYEIKLRDEGGMTQRYHSRFEFHRGMLWLQDVPGFLWVYIHIGNTDDDTEGCLLVGYHGRTHVGKQYTVGLSTSAYEDLYKQVVAALDAGDRVYIMIGDLPC